MNGTPRLRSAFPQTPQTTRRIAKDRESQSISKLRLEELKSPAKTVHSSDAPLIPFELVDAPSQRLYVVAFYVAINTWKFYESWDTSDDLDSTWLFLKWLSIDGIFLFGLQALRIPWLEWAFPTTLAIFLLHIVGNIFWMFRIPIPISAWISAMIKLVWDRELAISERHVKPADILHNASLILGKQIVHILPEGSAVLNPDQIPLCLDEALKDAVSLPIRVNQTEPIVIELLRLDLNTGENETISIQSKQLKQLKRQADHLHSGSYAASHRDLLFPIKKTGIYRLQRVVDESKLDVRMKISDTLVVSCPRALLKDSHTHKCNGELSNLVLEVEGMPPLKVKYRRLVNRRDRGFSFQNIQPDNLRSPLVARRPTRTLFDHHDIDVSWARSQKVKVPLNESLNEGGEWFYLIEEVHDGCGNVANYSASFDEIDRTSIKSLTQWHQFYVHERPRLSLSGCNDRQPLEVARGETVGLPIRFHVVGQGYSKDGPFKLFYSFNPSLNHEEDAAPIRAHQAAVALDQKPQIKEQGWYTLNSVSSQFCSGEIIEPSSCYLHHPPEPDLTVRYEKIFDKCANNSMGLLVDLDLTGSPPFHLRYSIEHAKGVETKNQTINALRTQLEFTPKDEGSYRYRFLDIMDTVYGPRSLKDKTPILEQDVKPPASAHFVGSRERRRACYAQAISAQVAFKGESPWVLQYELIHNGRKSKHILESERNVATIETEKLVSGGEYTLALTSITDRSNCKRLLKDSIKIDARSKPPHVAFGQIDKKRSISILQGTSVKIPVRLSGERPWTLQYKNVDKDSRLHEKTFFQENDILSVEEEGVYELVHLVDNTCPGTVDEAAKNFEVLWIPRPHIASVDGTLVGQDGQVVRSEVCQGDGDSLELKFSGTPPFSVRYEHQRRTDSWSSPVKMRSLTTAVHTLGMEMDTSEPGIHSYKFTDVNDNLYDYDSRSRRPVLVVQKVNPLPSARFDSPGRIYGFCKEEDSGEESIPITIHGVPPFTLEISVKHHSSSKPEIVTIPNVNSNRHNLLLPRRHLDLGQHVVSIHRIRDARGCQRPTEYDSSSVRVAVSDVPTIIPLDSKVDYCVGERISFSLSGHAPFEVYYTFDGTQRKATSPSTNFRRLAERPGEFVITAVSDSASGKCKAHKNISKTIHPMPSVRISNGQVSVVDIHEGGEAEIKFEFWGTPPFEFTYIRSSIARKGKKAEILDIKHAISHDHIKTVKTSDEGTYEVVAIKDKYCSFSSQKPVGKTGKMVTE